MFFSIKDYVQNQLLIYAFTWSENFSCGLVTFLTEWSSGSQFNFTVYRLIEILCGGQKSYIVVFFTHDEFAK